MKILELLYIAHLLAFLFFKLIGRILIVALA